MISRLPIRWNQPVVAGFMNLNSLFMHTLSTLADDKGDWRCSEVSGSYASGGVAKPRTLPLRGKYNDYGSVTFDKDNLLARGIATQLIAEAIPRKSDFRLWDDMPSTPDVDVLAKIAERGALHMKPQCPQYAKVVPVGLWMVHESIYDALVAANKGYALENSTSVYSYHKRAMEALSEYKSRMTESVITARKVRDTGNQGLIDLHTEIASMRAEFRDLLPWQIEPGPIHIYDWLREQDVTQKQLDEVSDVLVDFVHFCWALDEGRYDWCPVPGAGSQNDSIAMQKVVAQLVMQHKVWDDEDDE